MPNKQQVCFRLRASLQRRPSELVLLNRRGELFFFTPQSEAFFDFFQLPRSPEDYLAACAIDDGKERARLRKTLAEFVGMGLLAKTEDRVPWHGKLLSAFPELLRRSEERAKEVAFL